MVTRKQSIENFSNKMDELINGSYILSDKKITNVLKAITSSKLLFELVAFCNEDYSYEFDRERFDRENSPFVFDDDKQLIAFGMNLLARLDSKDEDLLAILSKNYNGDNFDKAYKDFARGFLTRFKNVVIKTANLMLDESKNDNSAPQTQALNAQNSGEQKTQNTLFSPQPEETGGEIRRNYQTCYTDIQQIIANERTAILHCRIKESEKSDLLTLLDAFKENVFMGNKEQVRISFISYKYSVSTFKKLDSEVDDIERILKFCKIL